MEDSKIDNATIIEDVAYSNNLTGSNVIYKTNTNKLEIHTLFYLFSIILLLSVYVGPFIYFKYYKKKNFLPNNNIGVKHAI